MRTASAAAAAAARPVTASADAAAHQQPGTATHRQTPAAAPARCLAGGWHDGRSVPAALAHSPYLLRGCLLPLPCLPSPAQACIDYVPSHNSDGIQFAISRVLRHQAAALVYMAAPGDGPDDLGGCATKKRETSAVAHPTSKTVLLQRRAFSLEVHLVYHILPKAHLTSKGVLLQRSATSCGGVAAAGLGECGSASGVTGMCTEVDASSSSQPPAPQYAASGPSPESLL